MRRHTCFLPELPACISYLGQDIFILMLSVCEENLMDKNGLIKGEKRGLWAFSKSVL